MHMHIPLLRGGDKTSRAVIVPGTTMGSGGEIPPSPGNLSTVRNVYYGLINT